MLENATRICEASFGTMLLFDDEAIDTARRLHTRHLQLCVNYTESTC